MTYGLFKQKMCPVNKGTHAMSTHAVPVDEMIVMDFHSGWHDLLEAMTNWTVG